MIIEKEEKNIFSFINRRRAEIIEVPFLTRYLILVYFIPIQPNFPYKNIRGISEGRLSSFQDQHKLVKKGSAQVGEARDEKICRQSKQNDKLFKPIEGL